jgi:phospholipid-binding lipoprotein MlaA
MTEGLSILKFYQAIKTNRFPPVFRVGCVAIALVLAGCATAPPANDPEAMAAYKQANDPYEGFNRAMFEVNLGLDKALIKPVAFVYKEAVPDIFQNFIKNFLDNLRSPIIFANDLMQGEFKRAGDTLVRFMMNSTFGVAGINDFAGEVGIMGHDEDFGQTLAVAGTEPGPYLMLPIFGPSNPRDGIGILVDILLDPLTFIGSTAFGFSRSAARAVDSRARRYDAINDLERTSLDFYATVRSLHRQRRADEIRNGAPSANRPAPMISGSADRPDLDDSKISRAQ